MDATSQSARVDALQGIVHASALLAASAAELVAELGSRPNDPPEAGKAYPTLLSPEVLAASLDVTGSPSKEGIVDNTRLDVH